MPSRRVRETVVFVVLLAAYVVVITGYRPSTDLRVDPLGREAGAVESFIDARRFPEALSIAKALRARYPNDPLPLYWLASIHRELNDARAEIDDWDQYLRAAGTLDEACRALPDAYARVGRQHDGQLFVQRCADSQDRKSARSSALP